MNVKVLLIFCDTSATVQPRLTFADARLKGLSPHEKRRNEIIIVYYGLFLKKTNTSKGSGPCVSFRKSYILFRSQHF